MSPINNMDTELSLGRYSTTTFVQENEGSSEASTLHFYHQALELERLKIEAFQRELPLSMQLLDRALEVSREQLVGRSEIHLNTSLQLQCKDGVHESTLRSSLPALGEYRHVKRKRETLHEELEPETAERAGLELLQSATTRVHQIVKHDASGPNRSFNLQGPKVAVSKCWLNASKLLSSSEELTNGSTKRPLPSEDEPPQGDILISGVDETSVDRDICQIARASKQLKVGSDGKEQAASPLSVAGAARHSAGQPQRKPRRCWSPELHQRFLDALHQLGGSQVATPKQIRDLMNVQDLTNDEVKSHLQKYRLHMRRPNPASSQTDPQQGTHLVVVGRIWVPPEYASQTSSTAVDKPNFVGPSTLFSSDNCFSDHANHRSHAKRNGSVYLQEISGQSHLVCYNLMELPGRFRRSDPRMDGNEVNHEDAGSLESTLSLNESHQEKIEINYHLERLNETNTTAKDNEFVISRSRPFIHRNSELQTSFLTTQLQKNVPLHVQDYQARPEGRGRSETELRIGCNAEMVEQI